MTQPLCTGCRSNPTYDQATICKRCENQTRCRLADQASHYRELVTALTRMVRMSAENDGGRTANQALAWAGMGDRFLDTLTPDLLRRIAATLPPARPAADAIHSQRSLLAAWCRTLYDEGIARGLPAERTPAMAGYIAAHLGVLRRHEAAGELVAELRDLERQIMRVIDTPSQTRITVPGPCPGDIDDQPCPGRVEALIPRDETRRPVMRCLTCGAEWPSERWLRAGQMILRRLEQAA